MRALLIATLVLAAASCSPAQGSGDQAAAADVQTVTNTEGKTVYIKDNHNGTFTAHEEGGGSQTGSQQTIERIFKLQSPDATQQSTDQNHPHVDDNFNDTQ